MVLDLKCALLVIDMQQYGDVYDGISVMKDEHTLENIPRLLKFFRENGLPVIQTQEVHRADKCDYGRELDGSEGIHCLDGTEAVKFSPYTRPAATDHIVIKKRYSAFFATDLDLLLKCLGISTLVIARGLTDVDVKLTAVDAHQNNYHFYVVTDGVRGTCRKANDYALLNMRYLQRNSNVECGDILNAKIEKA